MRGHSYLHSWTFGKVSGKVEISENLHDSPTEKPWKNGYESVNRNNKRRINARNTKGIKGVSYIKNSFSSRKTNRKQSSSNKLEDQYTYSENTETKQKQDRRYDQAIGLTQWLPDMQQEENIASPLGEDNNKTWSDY